MYALVKAIAPGILLLLAACGASGPKSDWERANEEKLPAAEQQRDALTSPPQKRGELIEFFVAATSEFRFFVDAATLSVSDDGIVRYVLVARSASGVENVSFEGLRCPGEYRVYAVGRADGSWAGRAGEWRAVPRDARAGQNALARRYLCPARVAIQSAEEGRRALREGGHPAARSKEH